MRRDSDGGHLGRARFGVGIQRRATKNHAVVLDDGVVGHVALNLGAVALDQRAVFLKRLNQLQDAGHVVGGGFAQLFQLFIDHHRADAVVDVNLQQQRAIDGKRNDVAALDAALAGFDAVLQIKGDVGGALAGRHARQQLFGLRQRQFGVQRVVLAFWLLGAHANAGHFGHKNQLIRLERHGDRSGDFFHVQVKRLAGGRKTKRRQQHQRVHVE